MKTRKIFVLFASICLVLVLGMSSMGICAGAPPKPATIILGTHEIGTGGHRLMALVIESLVKKYPEIKWRAIPSGVDLARTMMPRTKETVTTIHAGTATWMIQEGMYTFANLEWGPQAIRNVYYPEHVGLGFAVRGDSDIKTGYDLKGKRVAIYPGSPGPTLLNESELAFFGLTWKDVIPVKTSSPGEGYRNVRDGHIDTAFINSASSVAIEMASMPSGIRWLDMPAGDKEGWKRVQELAPPHVPKKKTKGPGISEEDPAEIITYGYPIIMAYDKSDEASVYWITRALIETRSDWEGKHASLKEDWTFEKHWGLFDGGISPMHRGAVRYYKEIGVWTPEREKMNQERIQYQKKLRAYWDEVVQEAGEKKIKAKAFPDYWMEKYKARFGK